MISFLKPVLLDDDVEVEKVASDNIKNAPTYLSGYPKKKVNVNSQVGEISWKAFRTHWQEANKDSL